MSQTLRPSGDRLARVERSLDFAEQAEKWDGNGIFHAAPAPVKLLRVRETWGNAAPDGNDNIIYTDLEDAFPDVDPGVRPAGSLVLLQMRQPPLMTAGRIFLPPSDVQSEKDNCQIGKVLAIGPVAFHNRNTGEPWPEGAWCKVGDYVRVPKYRGDLWTVPYARTGLVSDGKDNWHEETKRDFVRFVLFKDLDITGDYTMSPLDVRAFL